MVHTKFSATNQTVRFRLLIALLLGIMVASGVPQAVSAAPNQQVGTTNSGHILVQHPVKVQHQAPSYPYPTIVTRWNSNVRKGPHKHAPKVSVLPPNYVARITGKNIKATWWEIETIEAHPKKLGWIAKSIVYTYGDWAGVRTLAHPKFTIYDKAAHVYQGPGFDYPVWGESQPHSVWTPTGRTNNNGWWQVQRQGNYGWFSAKHGSISGDFWWLPVVQVKAPVVHVPAPHVAPTPHVEPKPHVPSVPVYKQHGHAPANACYVQKHSSVSTQHVNIYVNPGHQWGVSAYLANWAYALQHQNGWYQVWMGPESTGWVWGQEVQSSGVCPWHQPAAPHAAQPVAPHAAQPQSGSGY